MLHSDDQALCVHAVCLCFQCPHSRARHVAAVHAVCLCFQWPRARHVAAVHAVCLCFQWPRSRARHVAAVHAVCLCFQWPRSRARHVAAVHAVFMFSVAPCSSCRCCSCRVFMFSVAPCSSCRCCSCRVFVFSVAPFPCSSCRCCSLPSSSCCTYGESTHEAKRSSHHRLIAKVCRHSWVARAATHRNSGSCNLICTNIVTSENHRHVQGRKRLQTGLITLDAVPSCSNIVQRVAKLFTSNQMHQTCCSKIYNQCITIRKILLSNVLFIRLYDRDFLNILLNQSQTVCQCSAWVLSLF